LVDAIEGLPRESIERIQGIGICGYGNGAILLDEANEPLRHFIASSDLRATTTLKDLESEIGKDWFRARNRQTLYPGQLPILLRWIKENETSVYLRVQKVMLVKDYVRWLLTGDWHSDFSDMGATGLLNTESASYNAALLDAYGISDIQPALPQLHNSASCLSYSSTDFAASMNIGRGTPVATGCIDAEATSIGSGISGPGSLSIVAGTWSINQCIVAELPESTDFFLSTFSARDKYFWILEGSATSANNFEWFIKNLCETEANDALLRGEDPFEYHCNIASQTELRYDSPVFLPFLEVRNSGACFAGLRPSHSKQDLVRAVIEGVVLGHRHHVDKLRNAGLDFSQASLGGGLSKSSFVSQVFADILGLPIEVADGPETGPLGAAILAGVSIGLWPSIPVAQAALCTEKMRYFPDESRSRIYDQKYERYSEYAYNIAKIESYQKNETINQID
jgi:L-xylulokinase